MFCRQGIKKIRIIQCPDFRRFGYYNRRIAVGLMLLSLIKRETCHFISLQLSMLLIINGNFSVQTLGVITRKTASTIIFKEV